MDTNTVNEVLEGRRGIDELSVAQRMAFAKLVVRAEVKRANPEPRPTRFLLPPAIEAMYRGRSI